jgi:hypothetical protein
MGAVASIEDNNLPLNGKLYKVMECKCIYSCIYQNNIVEDIELLCCCYMCLHNIRNKLFDYKKLSKFISNTINNNICDLINNKYDNWLSERNAIIYAQNNKISVIEFIQNENLLKKFSIYP